MDLGHRPHVYKGEGGVYTLWCGGTDADTRGEQLSKVVQTPTSQHNTAHDGNTSDNDEIGDDVMDDLKAVSYIYSGCPGLAQP